MLVLLVLRLGHSAHPGLLIDPPLALGDIILFVTLRYLVVRISACEASILLLLLRVKIRLCVSVFVFIFVFVRIRPLLLLLVASKLLRIVSRVVR